MMTDMLERQFETLSKDAVTFLLIKDEIIGFNLSYQYGSRLWTRVVGFDYAAIGSIPVYTQLVFVSPIQYCQQVCLSHVELGLESVDTKGRY